MKGFSHKLFLPKHTHPHTHTHTQTLDSLQILIKDTHTSDDKQENPKNENPNIRQLMQM